MEVAGSWGPQAQLSEVVPAEWERAGTTEVTLAAARDVILAAEAILVMAVRYTDARADAMAARGASWEGRECSLNSTGNYCHGWHATLINKHNHTIVCVCVYVCLCVCGCVCVCVRVYVCVSVRAWLRAGVRGRVLWDYILKRSWQYYTTCITSTVARNMIKLTVSMEFLR